MFNKELMLIPKAGKDYTHILVVANIDSGLILGYDVERSRGSISPSNITLNTGVFDIDALYADNDIGTFVLIARSSLRSPKVYLGRSDTRTTFGVATINPGVPRKVQWANVNMLGLPDIGKEVPIWLASTPPPY